ncbi:unnamed protein product [Caenorhabditis auriculariae]|uniref:Uncharacterized protein n=1 Tax=Caenorhabditis auriculariae TaxID=2777116 RepID=A0A8S1GT08_9PELO|nr:unnamed protein product [Caenorhabditis auriculariae]
MGRAPVTKVSRSFSPHSLTSKRAPSCRLAGRLSILAGESATFQGLPSWIAGKKMFSWDNMFFNLVFGAELLLNPFCLILFVLALCSVCRKSDYHLPIFDQLQRIAAYYILVSNFISNFCNAYTLLFRGLAPKFAGFSRSYPFLLIFIAYWRTIQAIEYNFHDCYRNIVFSHCFCLLTFIICVGWTALWSPIHDAYDFSDSYLIPGPNFELQPSRPLSHVEPNYFLDCFMPLCALGFNIYVITAKRRTRAQIGVKVFRRFFFLAVFQGMNALLLLAFAITDNPLQVQWMHVDLTTPLQNVLIYALVISIGDFGCQRRKKSVSAVDNTGVKISKPVTPSGLEMAVRSRDTCVGVENPAFIEITKEIIQDLVIPPRNSETPDIPENESDLIEEEEKVKYEEKEPHEERLEEEEPKNVLLERKLSLSRQSITSMEAKDGSSSKTTERCENRPAEHEQFS